MSNFAFFPTEEQKENSNISRFMKKHKISSLGELSTKAKNNLEWFWKEVEKEIGIVWDKEYEKVLDLSKGLPWPQWFVSGKTNIYNSSVGKFSKLFPKKIAYTFVS
ncbi:MAG: acetyl-coenzyme A synthetase N-terminal domain-containing protein, partial [Nitrosopumilaceae archaeon]